MCNNTCMASYWLAQLAKLLFVLIRLLIATKMASNFGDATFTFKIYPVFNFEINDKEQTDAREKGKSWKRLAQHLVIGLKSTQNMKGIPQIHWPIPWLIH